MVHWARGHSPIFVSDDMNKIEIVRDPTHSWAYYASDFLVNVYEHKYKADYHPGDVMFFEYLTPRNDIVDVPCFNFTIHEEVETGGYHLINIIVEHVESSLYCTEPFFDPWSVSAYNTHDHWESTAVNRTRVVVFIKHEQQPYVLAVGKTEAVLFRDMLRYSYIKLRVQEWSDVLTLPWSILIAYSIAIALWTSGQWFRKTPSSFLIMLIIFSYVANMGDMVYNYIRIGELEMNTNEAPDGHHDDEHEHKHVMDLSVFFWIHILIPLLFIGLLSAYFVIREDVYTVCPIGTWLELHASIDILTLFLFAIFSLFLFQPGAMLASLLLFILAIYELSTVQTVSSSEIKLQKAVPLT
jgi:hypothetical protein